MDEQKHNDDDRVYVGARISAKLAAAISREKYERQAKGERITQEKLIHDALKKEYGER